MGSKQLFDENLKRLGNKELFFCNEKLEYKQTDDIDIMQCGDDKTQSVTTQQIVMVVNEINVEQVLRIDQKNDAYNGLLKQKYEGIPMVPLYLYYDTEYFEKMISNFDISEICERYRIVILVGKDALNEFFCELDTLIPNVILGDYKFAFTNIIKNIYQIRGQVISKILMELKHYYIHNEKAIRTRIKNKNESVCVVRNYFEPRKFRYFYQQLKDSLEKSGCTVNISTERGTVFRTPDILSIYKYRPDVVFQINKARNGRNFLGESLNLEYFPQLFFVNWIQDIHPAVLDENYAKTLKKNDILFSLFDKNVMDKYHYPMSNVILGGIMPADSKNYCIHDINSEEHSKYDCDIAFIGTIMTDARMGNFIYESLSPLFSDEQIGVIADSLFTMLENIYNANTGIYNITGDELNKYVYMLQEKMQLSEEERLNVYRVFSVVRYNSLRKLVLQQLVKKNKYRITLYGEIDSEIPGVKFGGFIENKEELSKAIQCSNMVIQINPDASMNQRVIEGLLSHTMALVFKMDDESDMSNIKGYLKEGEGICFFRSKQDLFRICDMILEDSKLREDITDKGYKKAVETLTTDAIFKLFIDELSKKVQ